MILDYFYKICSIPHCSGHEDGLVRYIISLAKKNRLAYKLDAVGNLLITKEAFKGYEHLPTVVLQSHLDMVCEKKPGYQHDFFKDPIKTNRDGDWIRSIGTSLGADNGIGVAIMLEIMADRQAQHGALEFLFTIEEETALRGAYNINENFFRGNLLINLDTEDDGVICIGCAGGIRSIGIGKFLFTKPPKGLGCYRITVEGLNGGHSGIDINKGRLNAIKVLAKILNNILYEKNIFLASLQGGDKDNAIPRQAEALILFSQAEIGAIKKIITESSSKFQKEAIVSDPGLRIDFTEEAKRPNKVFNPESQKRLLDLLITLPSGPLAVEKIDPKLTRTSTNLASINLSDNTLFIRMFSRSSSENDLSDLKDNLHSIFIQSDFEVKEDCYFPAWQPDPQLLLFNVASQCYQELFREEAGVLSIHAGLECAIFKQKIPSLDLISIGPNIENAHSPSERVSISSIEKSYKLLLTILQGKTSPSPLSLQA
ncbi:MAG: beta-Ala-His dipeptidase [bacterium]